jgi:mono/diheme cytochrome c family protein
MSPVTVPRFSLLSLCVATTASAQLAQPDFVKDVKPILEANCVRCHQESKDKGDLRMDNREDFFEGGTEEESVVPGDLEASGIIKRILLRPIDEGYMPDKGRALEPQEIDTLVAWVKSGAHWPDGVTLTAREPEPPQRAPMPERAPKDTADAARMLDAMIRHTLDGENIVPTGPVDDLAFLRRTTIDLIGRIPEDTEIDEFMAWPQESRRTQLVEKLLEHPRFADRWSVFFADMLRIRSNEPGADRWLGWVHGSIRDGKPYDEMVRELIASSGRPGSAPAVGFLLAEDVNPLELGSVTAQVFLGVRIGCAMCHDHPFDDWEQKDFYEFSAFFGKTRQVGRRDRGSNYITEAKDSTVLWPPEDKAGDQKRSPIKAHYPFELVEFIESPDYIRRFEAKRTVPDELAGAAEAEAELDDLLDAVDTKTSDEVLAEAKDESRALEVEKDLYKSSELRARLADRVTDPRNPYFARAFVNRLWAELVGHGFVEPLDNFSAYNDPVHGSAMDFLAQEFIASGFDLRELMRIILASETYRRTTLPAGTATSDREHIERYFAAAPARRMLGEALYDSIVIAGHLERPKWPAGANLRTIERQVRVRIDGGDSPVAGNGGGEGGEATMMAASMNGIPATRGDGYDLETTLELDFDSLQKMKSEAELIAMREAEDKRIADRERAMAMAAQAEAEAAANKTPAKFEMRTVTSQVDDNPVFGSALRMASPAPPAHFLRVFGQPSREGLGEFREQDASMRQQLMMLNGRLTHEASRVGPLEPIHAALQKDPAKAVDIAYLEILTRHPSDKEKQRALELLAEPGDPADHMADLRWALLNSHEFRYLP